MAFVTGGLVLASCTGPPEPPPPQPQPGHGGTFRTAVEDFAFTGAFDPTGEHAPLAFALYSQLLLRTLVTYRHVSGDRGTELVPDLATSVPEPSPDGLTYAFRLKRDLRWARPVDRPIVSSDIEYAFRRIDTAPLLAQYGGYYDGLIVGMNGPQKEMPADIEGIDTPDDRTIVFRLSHPAGDFLHRLALPAAAPIPEEAARCFTRAGDYGRNLVSSGPYMIDGSNDVDISTCGAIRPLSGFDPVDHLTLVRNPSYSPESDEESGRMSYVEGFDIEIETNTDEILRRIVDGTYHASLSYIWRHLLEPPKEIEGLAPLLHELPSDRLVYLAMNLLVPPFDDVHVRRAVNLVLSRRQLTEEYNTEGWAEVATHVFPWYPAPRGLHPDPQLEEARAEMAESRYDTDRDGTCDADPCSDVYFSQRSSPPDVNLMTNIIQAFASLGIELVPRELTGGTGYTAMQTVKNLVPVGIAYARSDYLDPTPLATMLHSRGIACEGQVNFSEVGMTHAQATECDVVEQYEKVGGVPSLDADIEACERLSGTERTGCWMALERTVMEDLAPWAPILSPIDVVAVSRHVEWFGFDRFSHTIALCHVALLTEVPHDHPDL